MTELPGFWGVKNVSEINLGVPGQVMSQFFLLLYRDRISVGTMLKFAIFSPNSEPQADLLEIYKAGGGGGGKAS